MCYQPRASAILVLMVALSAPAAWSGAADTMPAELEYEPAEVTLVGRLTQQVFPGRPSYHRVAEGDEREEPFILKLAHPVSVVKGKLDPDLQSPEKNVRAIHVWAAPKGEDEEAEIALDKLMQSFIGDEVVIQATPSHGSTAHHHTDVMAGVRRIKRKGALNFPALAKRTAREKIADEAKAADREEAELKRSDVIETSGPLPLGMPRHGKRVQLKGLLAKSKVPVKLWRPADTSSDLRTVWVLRLDHPISVQIEDAARNGPTLEQLLEGLSTIRLLAVLSDPLVRRNLRAAGIETDGEEDDPRYESLFGRHVRVTGTLETAIILGPKPDHYEPESLELEMERIEWLPAEAAK